MTCSAEAQRTPERMAWTKESLDSAPSAELYAIMLTHWA